MLGRVDDVEAGVLALLEAGKTRDAASAALRAYGPAVFGYLSKLLDPDDALEAFQRWAEDLWRGLPGFHRECRLRLWAFRLAYRVASRFHRDPPEPDGPPRGRPAGSAARPAGDLADGDDARSWDDIAAMLGAGRKPRP